MTDIKLGASRYTALIQTVGLALDRIEALERRTYALERHMDEAKARARPFRWWRRWWGR